MCRAVHVPVVTGDDDVNACAGLADVLGLLVVHLPQRVRERSGGVDHALGLHIKLLPCEQEKMIKKENIHGIKKKKRREINSILVFSY